MTTTVEISIAGRDEADAPRLADLIEQVQDFFAMLNGVAETLTGDAVERFDWRVVGMSKNSPARLIVEAYALPGHADGPEIAAKARDLTTGGLRQLMDTSERPLYWNDNVVDAADRFLRRNSYSLAETTVGSAHSDQPDVVVDALVAVKALRNVEIVREADPVHPYKELGSFEGHIQSVGADGYGRPFISIRSRVAGNDVKCFLSGEALRALENEPVAKVVWRHRRVTAVGVLRYRSVGRLSQADVTRLDFIDPAERLPQLADIIDPEFTGGLTSADFLERVRNGEA